MRALVAALLTLVCGCASGPDLDVRAAKGTAREHPSSPSTTAGTFERLNALQHEAGALKTTLAVRAFYRARLADSEGGLHDAIAQVLAATDAELGDYDAAVRRFPFGTPALRTMPALPSATDFHAADAVDAIAALAASRRIVLINEAHHAAQTRLLTLALLPRLRAMGFTHFAAEGLDERDRDLATRGYPLDSSGVYVREPLYGEIIRSALRLGFVVVAYESTTVGADADAREEQQAHHLIERVFRPRPQARLFVHAGYAHVHHQTGFLFAEPMAMRLARMSGFEPLSIDQTMLRPIDAQREYRDYRALLTRFAIHETRVLRGRDEAAWSLQPAHYDVSVILAPSESAIVGRPAWLTLGGERETVPIDLDLDLGHFPCVVEARYDGESARAVPADRTVAEHGGRQQVVLFLRPGKYRLSALDASGRGIFERELRVDAARQR
ncbi:MAG: hypothetical protein ABI846_15740 [Rudaea sp.]